MSSRSARWRDKLRVAIETAFMAQNAQKWRSLWLVLKLNTNPLHADDREIVRIARALADGKAAPDDDDCLLDRLTLLLKHDWERAKYEAGTDSVAPRRISYEEFKLLREGAELSALKCWSRQRPR